VPIDFKAIAGRFGPSLTVQASGMTPAFKGIGDAVKLLGGQIGKAEKATSGFPLLRYYNGALTVHVDTLGRPLLQGSPQQGLTDDLRESGENMVGGLAWVKTAATQELGPLRMLASIRAVLSDAESSIKRASTAKVGMFNPREQQLADLLGILVLGFNTIVERESRDQVVRFAYQAGFAAQAPLPERIEVTPAVPDTLPVAAIDTLVAQCMAGTSLFADLIMLMPILGDVLVVTVESMCLEVKSALLPPLMAVEETLYGLRAAAIDALTDLNANTRARDLLDDASIMVLHNILIFTDAYPSLIVGWSDSIAHFVRDFREAADWLHHIGYTEAFGAWLFVDPAQKVVDALLGDLQLPPVDGSAAAYRRRNAAQDDRAWVYAQLQATPPELAADPPRPTVFAPLPDIHYTLFGDGIGEEWPIALVSNLLYTSADEVVTVVDGAKDMVSELTRVGANPPELVNARQLRRAAAHATSSAARIFRPELEDARTGAAARSADALALAFGQSMADGGFALAGAAFPVYVGEMRAFWASRRARIMHPTSPHIIAKRRRLARVRVPRMTLSAVGRTADPGLAELVSSEFHAAVDDAYIRGRVEFERGDGAAPATAPLARARLAEPRQGVRRHGR
jgi:hypothetical protein